MTSKPNAFTAGPTLKWGNGKPKPKRPDLSPSNSGIHLGDHKDPAISKARGALSQSHEDVIERWKRRAGLR